MRILLVLMIMLLVLIANAAHFEPLIAQNDHLETEDAYESIESGDRMRQRRVTCDLMNYGGKGGHSACATNCLSMGKAGGRCYRGVCQCRKTTYEDLKRKRFD